MKNIVKVLLLLLLLRWLRQQLDLARRYASVPREQSSSDFAASSIEVMDENGNWTWDIGK